MNNAMDPLRLLVVDDGPSLAELFAHLLPRRGNVKVLGPLWEVAAAAALFDAGDADLAAIDIDRTGGAGLALIGSLREATSRARVIAVTQEESTDLLVGALGAGACGFVPRRAATTELLRSLHRAASGELVIPEQDLHRLVGRLRRSGPDVTDGERVAALTARELEILRALSGGSSTATIASHFGISVLTVQSHVKNILAKLGVHSKVEAVALAWRAGSVEQIRSA